MWRASQARDVRHASVRGLNTATACLHGGLRERCSLCVGSNPRDGIFCHTWLVPIDPIYPENLIIWGTPSGRPPRLESGFRPRFFGFFGKNPPVEVMFFRAGLPALDLITRYKGFALDYVKPPLILVALTGFDVLSAFDSRPQQPLPSLRALRIVYTSRSQKRLSERVYSSPLPIRSGARRTRLPPLFTHSREPAPIGADGTRR